MDVRLHEVFVALHWHSAEHGAFPKDFAELAKGGMLADVSTLRMPADGAPLDVAGTKTSFVYLGAGPGGLTEKTDRAVWAWSRDGLAGESRWVLFVDGSRRKVPEAEFEKLLEETKARLAK
jgi:hypothetical protein